MTTWMRAWAIAALAVTGGSCGVWAASGCRAEYGYVAASGADPASGQTPAQVSARCVQEGGRDCDVGKFISREAAECIARRAFLRRGLRPWQAHLVYNVHHRTVIWAVQNTTSLQADRQDGYVLLIHATSGKVLERSGWSMVS